VCPYLRAESGAWRSVQASREHRCWAIEEPAALAVSKQRSLCLLPVHESCATYLAARPASDTALSDSDDDASLWPDTRSTPVVLEPAHGLLAPLAGKPARTGGQALLAGLMVLAFLVLVGARTTAPPSDGASSPDVTASLEAVQPSAAASPAAATPAPTPGASPTSSPAATPTATATASPAPTPAASAVSYRVRSGDTLSGIAARFDTTVRAIKAANDLTSNVIHPGQVLIIP
jgi:LysM repeat protein